MNKVTRLILGTIAASILVSPTLATLLAPLDQETMTICTSLKTGYQFISKTGECNERIYETRTWYPAGKAPIGTPGSHLISLTLCTSKSSANLKLLRNKCNETTQTTSQWQRPLGPPAAPTVTSVTAIALGQVIVESNSPSDDGGARITSIAVVATPYNSIGDTVKDSLTFDEKKTSQFTLTGLTPGINYRFNVTATNSIGISQNYIAVYLVPDIPSAPTITAIAPASSSGAQISYSAPSSDGGSLITSYTAIASPGGKSATVSRSGSGTIIISGLNSGTTYSFTVTASNLIGKSAPSTPSKTILMAAPIINAVAAATKTSALVSYSAPASDGASLITSYTATATPSGESATVTRSSSGTITIENLVFGETYSFTISAITNTGITLTSAASKTLLMALVPGAPSITSANACGAGCVQIFFTPPTTDGGAPITSYTATASPSGANTTITDTTSRYFVFTGLQSGTEYTFTITANNSVGKSLDSKPSAKVITHSAAVAAPAPVALTCANGGTCIVGDRGPGNGIVYYVSTTPFSSPGSTCNTACKYLEVAPSTWKTGSPANDPSLAWSTDTTTVTGQDITTASTEGISENVAVEKFNWKIGQGFYNTSVMKVSGATSAAQAAVLAYSGTDSSTGQWFIPSTNELNELCKYARGQSTGVPTVKCDTSGTLKTGTSDDLGGFVAIMNWSSSERIAGKPWYQSFDTGQQTANHASNYGYYVRPVRAF